jgi:hypothetical protein
LEKEREREREREREEEGAGGLGAAIFCVGFGILCVVSSVIY